jgi:hypothetical protein
MSKISITSNASGTGVFTISSPDTNTNRSLTLPDEAGTVLTSASSLASANLTGSVPSSAMPAGSVLQVVSNQLTSSGSKSGGSWQTILSASITPSNSSNKIIVMGTTMIAHLSGGALEFGLRLFNGTSAVVEGDASGSATRAFLNKAIYDEEYNSFSTSMSAMETAGTVSSKTYSIQGYGSESQGFYYNRTKIFGVGDYTFSGVTTIILMEIAA